MSETQFTLPSFAKINWHLRILGKRADDYHEISTIFQTVSLFDELSFAAADELSLTCDDPKIPVDAANLIIRAAEILREKYDVKSGAKIHLSKRIPAPGGLGGGSSNAAIALLALNKLWNLNADFDELAEIGADLGSDVPFFLAGGTACGSGRGTEIEVLNDIEAEFMLIVTPPVDVPTSAAFARLNAPRLTNFDSKSILGVCREKAERLKSRREVLENDFEQSVFQIAPEIGEVKRFLLDSGAKQSLLSGSGASVFAVFDSEETRQATIKAIEFNRNWRMFAVATISHDEYRAALKQVF